MGSHDEESAGPKAPAANPARREYVRPQLERLGTIRDLTLGLGMKNQFDGGHPPGQNKSIL